MQIITARQGRIESGARKYRAWFDSYDFSPSLQSAELNSRGAASAFRYHHDDRAQTAGLILPSLGGEF